MAGLRDCAFQHRAGTPKPVWNPDLPAAADFRAQWDRVPDNEEFDNGFKAQWELFLRHVVSGAPFRWDLAEGARACSWPAGPALGPRGPPDEMPGAAGVTPAPCCRAVRRRPVIRRRRAGRPRHRAAHPPGVFAAAHVAAGPDGRMDWESTLGSGTTCGVTGSAWPRRWTPRSAAWAGPGAGPGADQPVGPGRRRGAPCGLRRGTDQLPPGTPVWRDHQRLQGTARRGPPAGAQVPDGQPGAGRHRPGAGDYLNVYGDLLRRTGRSSCTGWARCSTRAARLLGQHRPRRRRRDRAGPGAAAAAGRWHQDVPAGRRRGGGAAPSLPPGVRLYTGDDFHYAPDPGGDGHSDALLGVFSAVTAPPRRRCPPSTPATTPATTRSWARRQR